MPFSRLEASADTNILSDFYCANHVGLLWQLFPDGIWIDPYILEEIRCKFGYDFLNELKRLNLTHQVERNFEDIHYAEMAEIKARRRGLKHSDIACIVIASKRGITCLSSDDAVRKTCQERGIPLARHLSCLQTAVDRHLISAGNAIFLLQSFIDNGLYLPVDLVDEHLARWEE